MLTCICARLGGRGVRACGPVGEIEYCVETRDRTQRRERTEPGGRAGPGRGGTREPGLVNQPERATPDPISPAPISRERL